MWTLTGSRHPRCPQQMTPDPLTEMQGMSRDETRRVVQLAIGWEDGDAIAAKRSNPDLVAHLDRNGPRTERRRSRFANDVENGERLRIDLHDVGGLRLRRASLAGGKQ